MAAAVIMRALGTVGAPLEKPRPKLLDQREQAAVLTALDKIERQAVKTRSGGRCEVWEVGSGRCKRAAFENHHLLGGTGRRNRGKSILAVHRLHTCSTCHAEITGHVLVPNAVRVTPTLRFLRVR